jgi:hypothetical protein
MFNAHGVAPNQTPSNLLDAGVIRGGHFPNKNF